MVVGLLWFCGFFNYADRQALSAVFPLLESEFKLTDGQLGLLGSAFMVVYAVASPFTGYTVDRFSRRLLVGLGLAFWSLICAATAFGRSFVQLLLLRGAEGLGESFYFPASMSVLADYHGPRTRSRAMSIHQTSVYLGTAGGWYLGGLLGERFGWRSPFLALGLAGLAYAGFLSMALVEPRRGGTTTEEGESTDLAESIPESAHLTRGEGGFLAKIGRIAREPAAAILLLVFVGANFVATTFLAWLPTYVFRNFDLGLTSSSLLSIFWPLASLPGALLGGIGADLAARRSAGGRVGVQAIGLILAAPFVFLCGATHAVPVLIVALVGSGLCKGIYDANIFASLFDVVRAEDRGTAAGLMNTLGWTGGFIAPALVGWASDRFGLGLAITATAAVYLLVGLLALAAAWIADARRPPSG